MTKMLRWSEANHDAWKQRQASAISADAAGREVVGRVTPLEPSAPFSITLPWPPTGNHATKHTRDGRHYLTDEYKSYRADVLRRVGEVTPHTLAIEVVALFWPPDKRARDLDNVWKSLGDSLQLAGVYVNDSQIDRLELVRLPMKRNAGEVRVTVKAAA